MAAEIPLLFDPSQPEGLAELEGYVHRRLGNRVRHLELEFRPEGLVIMGRAATYYAKQLAQEMARDACPAPIINAIEVCPQRT